MKTYYFVHAVVALLPLPLLAQIQCPTPPQQVSRDSKVAVEAAVGRLGPIKAGEVKANVERTTSDLLGKLPKADELYLEQMMFAAFCSSIRDSKSMTDTEKSKAIRDYAREVRRAPPEPRPSVVAPPTLDKLVETPSGKFLVLSELLGLPRGAQIGWGSDYGVIEKLLPAEERAISRVDLLAVDGRSTLNGVPARTHFHFKDRKLVKAAISVSARYAESKSWVVREPPVAERLYTEGDAETGRRICSPGYLQGVETRASSKFSRVRDRQEATVPDPAFTHSSYECNKYGCRYSARTAKSTSGFTHPESAVVLLEGSVWSGLAEYSKPSGRHDGGEQRTWSCEVRLTFSPQATGGL